MKKVFEITITDTATYFIKGENEDDAIELALEWFSEREPDVGVEELDEDDDYYDDAYDMN